jgi:DNA-binding Lrp family transcriptional regulator
MNMKPQDVLVALKLLVLGGRQEPYANLSKKLGLSPSEVHAAVGRLVKAGLLMSENAGIVKKALQEFLLYGLRYAFPAERGSLTRGMATSIGAPPLAHEFRADEADLPVWPDAKGEVRGYELKPLYRSVPQAARQDPKLYEWLALADALRDGRARERSLAQEMVKKRLATDA